MDTVTTKELTKRFRDITAVDHVSFGVSKGEIFGLIGPNGGGKTTIVRILCGLLTPSSGSATVVGYDVSLKPESVKERIGYMSQRFCLYDDHSVTENLSFFARLYGMSGDELKRRSKEILELVQLDGMEDRLAGNLSGGLKQRLALACAAIQSPELLFLDEPTAGVDPPLRRTLWDYFKQLNKGGITIFISTQYMDEALQCDRLGLLRDGHLQAVGAPKELRQRASSGDTVIVSCSDPKAAARILLEERYVCSLSVEEASVWLTVEDSHSAMPRIRSALERSGLNAYDISASTSLEDLFVRLTRLGGS